MKYITFEECRNFARINNIKNAKEWFLFKKPESIPSDIHRNKKYRDEWKGWGDFLGTNNCAGFKKIYSVNEDFFKIWSYDMAYILGLWWSDGCIKGNYRFEICLKMSDRYILEDIQRVMGSTYPLQNYKNSSRISMSSKKICEDIFGLGGSRRKSLTCSFPNVPEEYLSSFIRGCWDGDGCIWKSDIGYLSSIVSCSKNFIYGLEERLIPHIKGKIYCRKTTSVNPRYDFCLCQNETKKFRNFLYKNDESKLMLIRKNKLFIEAGEITRLQNCLPIEQARKLAKNTGIKTGYQWIKSKVNILGVPKRPDATYKSDGWKGWKDFLS